MKCVVQVLGVFLSLSAATAAAFAAGPPSAAATAASAVPVTQADLVNRARQEGALVVMAQSCKLDKAEVAALVTKSRTDTLALAKNFSLRFDTGAYRKESATGAEDARELLSRAPDSGPAFAKRCAQVKDKVKRKMAS